ncbi:hypothetical protein AruPA_19935, partial [Acidiphilium sp. PA]|nr:hypothetical protein [Acidiphilium sp. PA]
NLESLIHGRHERLAAGDFQEEPGAGKPPARIREGEAEWPSYSTTSAITGAWWIDAVTLLGVVWFLVQKGREAWIGECHC